MSAGNLELQIPDMFVQAVAERVAELLADNLEVVRTSPGASPLVCS
jgi:hypothetical protein